MNTLPPPSYRSTAFFFFLTVPVFPMNNATSFDTLSSRATLVATHQTSLLNEWGEERGKFALGDVLGVEYQGPGGQPEDHTIVYFCRDKDGFEQSRIVCFYSQESAVCVGACTHVLFSRSRIDAEVLRNFDPRVDFDSSEPAITSNRFGEGQAIYIAGDVGGAYMNSPYPCLRRLIKYLVMQTESPIEVEAPEVIEMTAAYRTPKELMIHFLGGIHLTGVTICSVHGVSSRWQALPGLGWRVSSLVSNRCGLPGLPRMAAVARRLRLSELRPRRRLALGRWPLHVSGVFDTQFGDGRYDLRSDADTLDDMVHRLLAVRHR